MVHVVIQNTISVWLIWGSLLFVVLVAFGSKLFHWFKNYNKKHHIIAMDDRVIDNNYDWDDDDDL